MQRVFVRSLVKDCRVYRSDIRDYFPSIFYLRRTVLIIPSVLFAFNPVWRQSCLVAVARGLLFLQLKLQPFLRS